MNKLRTNFTSSRVCRIIVIVLKPSTTTRILEKHLTLNAYCYYLLSYTIRNEDTLVPVDHTAMKDHFNRKFYEVIYYEKTIMK